MGPVFKSRLTYAALAVLVVFSLSAVYRGAAGALGDKLASKDFKWDAARLLLMRQNPLALTIEGKGAPTDAVMPDKLEAQELPSALMLILPYALFPWPAARVLWLLSNLVFTGIVVGLGLKLFAPGRTRGFYVIAAALFVAGAPWRNGITVGQHTLASLAFFLAALWYAERRRPAAAGVLLAFSLLKYSVTLPLLLYFIRRKHYRPLVIALTIHVAANLLAAAWLMTPPHVLVAQSVKASLAISGQGYLDLKSFFVHSGLTEPALLVRCLQAAGVIAAVAVSLRAKAGGDLLALSALSMLSVTVFYHRPYDFVVLFLPLVFVLTRPVSPLTLMLAASVAAVFYVNSLARAVCLLLPGRPDPLASPYYYAAVAALWYATLVVTVVAALRRRGHS